MAKRACAAVQSWLQGRDSTVVDDLPHPDLVEHATACPACRGLLAVAAVSVLDCPSPPAPITCADCESELDAFIDWEERSGTTAAARRFPQIWWHLLTCSECAEIHAGVHALLHAEASGDLMALPIPKLYPIFQLARSYLHAALAPQLELGVAWGAADAQEIASVQLGRYQIALSAYPTTETAVTLIVQIDPPAPGAIEMRLDPLFVRAPFAANGTAQIPAVPADALAAVAADDLWVDLELDAPID